MVEIASDDLDRVGRPGVQVMRVAHYVLSGLPGTGAGWNVHRHCYHKCKLPWEVIRACTDSTSAAGVHNVKRSDVIVGDAPLVNEIHT